MKIKTNHLFIISVIAAFAITLGDCISTWIALGMGLQELNPIVRMIGTGPELLIPKIGLVVLSVVFGYSCEKKQKGTKYVPPLALALVGTPILLNNVLWIAGVFKV